MRHFLLMVLLCCTFNIAAQDRETILDGEMEVSYFAGPTLKFAGMKGNLAGIIGGQGGLLINDVIYISGSLGSTVTEIGSGYTSFRYAGLLLGGFVKPNEAIHYFGDVGLYSGHMNSGGLPGFSSATDEKFSIIEPNIGVGVNLNETMKSTVGLSYKLVSAIDNTDLSKKDVGGFSLNGAIIFGF